jgi:tetratricopeptide (TPR) repeat protein
MNPMKKNSLHVSLFILALLCFGFADCTGKKPSAAAEPPADTLQPDTTAARHDTLVMQDEQVDTNWKSAYRNVTTPVKPAAPAAVAPAAPARQAVPKGEIELGNARIMPLPKKTTPPGFLIPEPKEELTSGLDKANKGDLKGAIADFTAAITKNFRYSPAYFYRAKANYDLGKEEAALPDLDSALKYNARMSTAYYFKGKIYSDQGKFDKAIPAFSKALEIRPDFPDALNYRGVANAKLGKHTEAIADYAAAIEKKADYAVAYYNKGTSEASTGQYQQAVASLTKAVELDNTNKVAIMNRGNCYVMLEKYTEAINDFNKLIEMDPKNADAYYNRGSARYLAGDDKMCLDWRKAASLGSAKAREAITKYCK